MGHSVPARGSFAVSCSSLPTTTTATTPDHKEVIMKTQSQIRISALSLLVILCLTLAALPASAQVLYDNGPGNGNADAWQINGGHVVSDSFQVSADSIMTGFALYVWELPGDTLTSVDWSITTEENGGTV